MRWKLGLYLKLKLQLGIGVRCLPTEKDLEANGTNVADMTRKVGRKRRSRKRMSECDS